MTLNNINKKQLIQFNWVKKTTYLYTFIIHTCKNKNKCVDMFYKKHAELQSVVNIHFIQITIKIITKYFYSLQCRYYT